MNVDIRRTGDQRKRNARTDANNNRVAVIYPYSTALNLGRALRKHGARTIAVIPANFDAKGMSDLRLNETDWDTIITAPENFATLARQLEGITGLVPGDESAVPLCEQLADYLHLTGNDPRTSICRTDKAAMQQALSRARVPYPTTITATSLAEALAATREMQSVVLKPLWSASSVGVHICETEQEVEAAWDAAIGQRGALGNLNRSLVVQQRLVGEKWTVDTVSVKLDGHLPKHVVTDMWREKVHVVDGGGVAWDASYLISDPTDSDASTVASYALSVLDAVGVVTGPANVEIMLTAQGPYLIEVAARLAGIYPSELVEQAIGHSQLSCTAHVLVDPTGFANRRTRPRPSGLSVAQIWLTAPADCQLNGEVLEQICELPCIKSCSKGLRAGAKVKRTVDTPSSAGYFNLLGSSSQLDETIRLVRRHEQEDLYVVAENPKIEAKPSA